MSCNFPDAFMSFNMRILRAYFLVFTMALCQKRDPVHSLRRKRTSMIPWTYKNFYLQVCFKICYSRDVLSTPNKICDTCYCDNVNCHVHKDCCPDIEPLLEWDYALSSCARNTFPELNVKNKLNDKECEPFVDHCKVVFETYPAYKLISTCRKPKSYEDQEAGRLCKYIDMDDRNTIHPVTDMTTDLSYRNVHCASCNGVANTKKWEMWVICRDELPDRFGNSFKELYDNFRSIEGCSVRFEPKGIKEQRKCDVNRVLIESCNITGDWDGRDTMLISKCFNPYPFENAVLDYRNVHCFQCNIDNQKPYVHPVENKTERKISDVIGVVSGYFETEQPVKYSVYDSYQKVCRPITCPDGRQFVYGNCISLFRQFNGHNYHICLRIKVRALKSKLNINNTDEFKSAYFSLFAQHFETEDIKIMYFERTLLRMEPCPTDVVDATLEFSITLSETQSSGSEDENVRYLQGRISLLPGSDTTTPFETLTVEQLPVCKTEELRSQLSSNKCLPYKDSVRQEHRSESQFLSYLYVAKPATLSNLLMCPQMVLDHLEVDYDFERDEITILSNIKTLTAVNFKLVDEGYLICVEDYIENGEIVETEACRTSGVSRLYGSFVACLIISIIRHQFI